MEDQVGKYYSKTLTARNFELKDIKLKWRNFVDDDEDNSKEEKYIKKIVLDILKNKKTSEYLQEELHTFYGVISKDARTFLSSMVSLLHILFASSGIMEGRKQQSKTALEVLKYLSEYIDYRSQGGEENK